MTIDNISIDETEHQDHSLSAEDWSDAYLAHKYRLSLPSSPSQSNFRVLALLFYEEIQQNERDRNYIVGTNDEPGYMGGAICAERAAMVQLRFVPAFRITKVVIATDCETVPISPGMLCREFLAGHGESVSWDLKVISTGSQCTLCKRKDEDIFPTLTTIAELYPFPSPFTRLTAPQSTLRDAAKRLLELAISEAKQSVSNEAGRENHPVYFGAAVVFEDESVSTSHQSSALEYGCSLDAVSQLVPYIEDKDCAPVLIVQADQYGVAHSPFAPARAYLSEHDYGDCRVLLHDTDVDDVACLDRWHLKEVKVTDLAPTPPTWTMSASSDTPGATNLDKLDGEA
eukprot:jgi/Psemu1/198713/e_gw1.224.91.1